MAAKKKANKPKLLVECYGLFWEAGEVYWGDQGFGLKGRLLGYRKNSKKTLVDFREQTGIYVLYANYKVLYVGQAGFGQSRLFARLKSHLDDNLAERWDRFSWFGLRRVNKDGKLAPLTDAKHPTTETVLNQMEAILITSNEPPLNRQGGKWLHAGQYLQAEDEKHQPKTADQIADLWEFMDEQKKAAEKAKAKAKKAKAKKAAKKK